MRARVLLYQVTGEKEARLRAALLPMGIEVRVVEDGELGETVETLANAAAEAAQKAPIPYAVSYGETLMMCGFSKVQFELLMGLFRNKKIAPIPVKAMLTETNRSWSFEKFLSEIWQEHQLLTKTSKKNKNFG